MTEKIENGEEQEVKQQAEPTNGEPVPAAANDEGSDDDGEDDDGAPEGAGGEGAKKKKSKANHDCITGHAASISRERILSSHLHTNSTKDGPKPWLLHSQRRRRTRRKSPELPVAKAQQHQEVHPSRQTHQPFP